MEEWSLPYYQLMGYHQVSVEPAGEDEWCDYARCECCNLLEAADGEEEITFCSTCNRGYHMTCLGMAGTVIPPEDAWDCPKCKKASDTCTSTRRTRQRREFHRIQNWLKVRCADTFEPKGTMHEDALELVEAYNLANRLDVTERMHRSSKVGPDLTPMQAQGVTVGRQLECRAGLEVRDKLHVDMQEINPHMDIWPTGKPEVQVREEVLWMGEKDEAASSMDIGCVYDSRGHCTHTISKERLQQLAARHQASGGAQDGFAMDVTALLHRYKNNTTNKDLGKQVQMKNHWACPDALMGVLREHLHLDGERFASPLNVNSHNTKYWTAFAADSAFGAQHDAFSEPWTGATEANPEYENADMDQAVTWAFYSAMGCDEPSFTVLVLPNWHCQNHPPF